MDAAEKRLEKRVQKAVRSAGWICEHLAGPDGWPDLSCFKTTERGKSPRCFHIELKVQRGRKHMRELMEQSQIAFFNSVFNNLDICILMLADDGTFYVEWVGSHTLYNKTIAEFFDMESNSGWTLEEFVKAYAG